MLQCSTDAPDPMDHLAPADDAHNFATAVPRGGEPAPARRGLWGPRAEKPVALALQGGGSHGAFTWGALDALIEDGRLAFEAVTGASAGAMNGTVLLDGWLAGGPDGARTALERFWRRASLDGRLRPAQRGLVDGWVEILNANPVWDFWAKAMMQNPYAFNPLDVNPLRAALVETVDFERLRAADTAALFVSATDVWSGKLAVFERAELTADHVMASACIPTVFKAVEIGGRPYWDGGYLGNPALYPLHDGARTRDVLLVQINPVERRETPRTSEAIADRLNEISFNANLMRELRAIDFVDGLIAEGQLSAETFEGVRMHRIDGTGELDDHAASTRLDARWRKLTELRDHGRAAARDWLAAHYDGVGRRCTLDLKRAYG